MASENEEKYGVLTGTAINEAEKGVKDTVNTVKQLATMGEKVCGYLERDIPNTAKWLMLPPWEQIARMKKEREDAADAAEKKTKKEKEEADAEEERIKEVKKSYIVHTAAIKCSFARHESYVVVPISHGEFIHGIPQLNVGDSKPNINVRSFGICKSPQNESVQENAKKIANAVKNRPKSFTEKVMDLFSKKPSEDVGKELMEECVGACTLKIFTEWIDGKEDVLIDGKQALLGRCKLKCLYDGEIEFLTSGQRE